MVKNCVSRWSFTKMHGQQNVKVLSIWWMKCVGVAEKAESIRSRYKNHNLDGGTSSQFFILICNISYNDNTSTATYKPNVCTHVTHTHTHTTAEFQSTLHVPAIMYIEFSRECNTPAYIKHATMWHSYSSDVHLYLNVTNINTVMCRLTTFRSTTDRIYDPGPTIL